MKNEIILTGCSPTPLAHYLKAIGILRLVAEQKDNDVRGRWDGDSFVLFSSFNNEELCKFFIDEYIPTPIIAPWNGGSGFYPKDNKVGINQIEKTDNNRFTLYKEVISKSKKIINHYNLSERPEGEDKVNFLIKLHSILPDDALLWLDAAFVISNEKLGFPPLLGTGGNDGRLDFTNNFMQHVSNIFINNNKNNNEIKQLIENSLFDLPVNNLSSNSVGQFNPGKVGGPNASNNFEGPSLLNPFDFIFLIEGAIMFAASSSRRLESNLWSSLNFPFTVKSIGSGSGSSAINDEEQARAEMWAPLWDKKVSYNELKMLLSEGRVVFRKKKVKDSFDFVRAISNLGADKGVDSFQRYSFLMRSGKAYLATPLNRIAVVRNPHADIIDDLDKNNWLERFRRFSREKETSTKFQQLVKKLEDAIFELTQKGDCYKTQSILVLLGEIENALANSKKAKEELPPMPWLGERWVIQANDGTEEYYIARAIAGIGQGNFKDIPLRLHIAPVCADEKKGFLSWDNDNKFVVWNRGSLVDNLINVIEKRLYLAKSNLYKELKLDEKPFDGTFRTNFFHIMNFFQNRKNDERILSLIKGLACVKIPKKINEEKINFPFSTHIAAYSILKPFFVQDSLLRYLKIIPDDIKITLPKRLVKLLATDNEIQKKEALELAIRKLRHADIIFSSKTPSMAGIDSKRLLATLIIPIYAADLADIAEKTFK